MAPDKRKTQLDMDIEKQLKKGGKFLAKLKTSIYLCKTERKKYEMKKKQLLVRKRKMLKNMASIDDQVLTLNMRIVKVSDIMSKFEYDIREHIRLITHFQSELLSRRHN